MNKDMNKDIIKNLHVFESNFDLPVLPNMYIVVRLDGRGFSNLTRKMNFKKPFDDKFTEVMCNIVQYIMQDSGFNILYGYTQSDEISFLLNKDSDIFNRRINKIISVLPSLAASIFTFNTKQIVSFDARLSQLPNVDDVLNYFHWRQHDASRNALNGYCYWTLRKNHSQKYVVNFLSNKTTSEQQEILFKESVNYNDITNWHKQGIGFYWKKEEKIGINPLNKEKVICYRNKLYKDENLSYGKNYSNLLSEIFKTC